MLKRGQRQIAISCQAGNGRGRYERYLLSLFTMLGLLAISAHASYADTPVTLYRSFAGNINITGTGGTLRTAADGTNSYSVTNSGSMQLLGVPAGSTITAAYLYWAGSGGDPAGGEVADYNVTFNGTAVTADRSYTASYNNSGNILYFFGGVTDVTSLVSGNATYTFADLTVQNANVVGGGSYRTSAAVLSAFALVVVYSNASETLHVVNLWEGLQTYRDNEIALNPSNFQIPSPAPTAALSGRHLVLTWEGDSGNSGAGPDNGLNEALTFCAPSPCTGAALTDIYNPSNNQFNSTVDVPLSGPFSGINTTWGVDIDMYDITSLLHAGDASAQAVYSSGADLVILANQTMSLPNTSVADLAITKAHIGTFPSGGTGTYQLTVHNNGPSAATGTAGNPIRVTDTIPAGLTYSASSGSGWTVDTSSLPTVRWNYVGTLANGADLPPITLLVSVSGAVGSSITNSATVNGPDFDHIAANNTDSDTVTVTFPIGTGNKPLYLYGSTPAPAYKLSRTPTPGAPAYVTINTGASRPWNQNPVLQSSVTLTPTLSANVPVYLYLARDNTTGNRNVRVDLQCSSGGTVLTSTQTGLALTTTPALVTFSLPLLAPLTCAAPNNWRLTIANTSAANRPIRVHPVSGGNISRVVLPSQNVINVDSISFYSAAYPGGSIIGSVAPGGTVFIRATVSDPFGSYDINGSAITITDSSGAIRVNSVAMTQALDSGAATKIYEYPYTVPAGGPAGNWTVRAVAAEGTEGNVTDDAAATMPVVIPPPLLSVVKTATPSPTVNPGQIVTYTVLVTNSGAGIATSVVAQDQFSSYLSWGLNSYGAGVPFQFTDGAPSSGLTLGTPLFSNNNGANWTYTPVSGGGGAPAGFDANVTNLQIPMTGTMNGGGANFTINYRVQIR